MNAMQSLQEPPGKRNKKVSVKSFLSLASQAPLFMQNLPEPNPVSHMQGRESGQAGHDPIRETEFETPPLLLIPNIGWQSITNGGGVFCPGKLTLGKILPGKNSVPELKNGGKSSVPSGFGRVKSKFDAKRRRNFWLIFLVDDSMKLNFP